ncbi:LOW QUALITY PROTEIN: Methyltransf_11 domain-containing protein, partial [Cephalotus follicularis]
KRQQSQSQSKSNELLSTLEDFTSKENWDKFYLNRGTGDSFEWYGEWTQLRDSLLSLLSNPPPPPPQQQQILVPGCGNSSLSEHLYDAGFHGITNVDFSKVVISDMLRRNVRCRPSMKWRVMDMTNLQFADETFDVVLDKGGLDALMEPELGHGLGNQYLSEVKRVLKSGGKFICLTLAELHVLALLFSKFRFGWRMIVHAVPQQQSTKPNLQTFMVVAEKEISTVLHQITSSFDHLSLDCDGNQAFGLREAFETENHIRRDFSNDSDVFYSLEDLKLGVKGDLTKLHPGHRFQLTLGGERGSRFSYKAVLLDARQQSDQFLYHCGVFIVPKVYLNISIRFASIACNKHFYIFKNSNIYPVVQSQFDQKLSHFWISSIKNKSIFKLIKLDEKFYSCISLFIGRSDSKEPIGQSVQNTKWESYVNKRLVTSSLTGPIVVEDVVYESIDGVVSRLLPFRDLIFRHLIFQRTEGLVQCEALLTRDGPSHKVGGTGSKKTSSSSKSKREIRLNDESSNQLKVYHDYLVSSFHTGIVSGFMLISSY